MQYIEGNLYPEYTLKVMEFTKLFEDKNLEVIQINYTVCNIFQLTAYNCNQSF